jgi:hypothetical protein
MKNRKIIGMIVTLIGITLSAVAIYAASYISGIKGLFHTLSIFSGHNPVSGFIGGEINKQTSAYDSLIAGSFWVGLLLLFVGLVTVITSEKKKR